MSDDEPDVQFKVYSLAYATSGEVLDVLETLLEPPNIRVAADRRTNSLIVKGPPETLAIVSALIAKLDVPASRSPAAGTRSKRVAPGRTPSAGNRPSVAKRSTRRIEVRNEVPGETTVQTILADGAKVNKGDLLVELDDSELLAEKERLLIELEGANRTLVRAEQDFVNQTLDIDVLEAAVQVAKLRREHAQAESKLELTMVEVEISLTERSLEAARRREAFFKSRSRSGAGGSTEADDASMAVLEAQSQLKVAVAKRELLTEHTVRLKSAELELETRQAELEMERAKRELAVHRARAEAEIGAVKASLQLTSARLARVVENAAKCKVYAPASGTVRRAHPRTGARQPILGQGASVRENQRLLEMEVDPPSVQVEHPASSAELGEPQAPDAGR